MLTTYSLVHRDIDSLAGIAWGRLVLDEAQQVKNPGTAQSRAVRRLTAGRRVALTGTPVENRLSELWSIMHVLYPGLLGPIREFKQRFAVPIERDGDEEATRRLQRITGPFILRRLKSDPDIAPDLPDKIERTDRCPLTREQATLYQAVVDDLLRDAQEKEGIDRRGAVLAGLIRLKQVCNHPALLLGDGSPLPGRSGKLTRVEELLDEILGSGDRTLCFTQFAAWGDLLAPYLSRRFGIETLWLHGGVPRARRDAMVAQFQSADGPPLILISLRAGGTGLNLTGASHVIHLDRWWNPAVEDQATDRAYRIGQRRTVLRPQAGQRGHGRGADRRDDQPQARPGPAGRRHRRGLAHRPEHRRPARRGVAAPGRLRGGGPMTPRAWDDPWPASPIDPAAGRRRARHQPATGRDGQTWWSRRFVEVLESYGLGARMQRGRRYARTGQVMSLDVSAGLMAAQVQGSRRTPYEVTIRVPTPTARQWRGIDASLRERIGLAANLLAGEVPPELEEVFDQADDAAVPASVGRSPGPLHVPGLRQPVQAHRRGALRLRRPARLRPVAAPRVARPDPRRHPRRGRPAGNGPTRAARAAPVVAASAGRAAPGPRAPHARSALRRAAGLPGRGAPPPRGPRDHRVARACRRLIASPVPRDPGPRTSRAERRKRASVRIAGRGSRLPRRQHHGGSGTRATRERTPRPG